MTDLVFDCVGARVERYSASPSMTLELRITETEGQRVEAIALRCQIRIEPNRRRYSAQEAENLNDLFGETARWADTLKPLQLANLSLMVPGFSGSTTVDLPLPVTYDLEIASTKYFHGLQDGVVPMLLLFSGTVFGTTDGKLQVQQVPWHKETSYPLPAKVWRETIDVHFPNAAWLLVHRETMDDLRRFKTRNALPTWESALTELLKRAGEDVKEE
ncbi:hypothetical protein JOF56_000413 [Kibdelosporangium banguiense]|uniref:Uncharacterized protein n=1 Tax=Kibdelosporangium banguiense TaxID=1365924 RepID=A0ABS4T6I2_9PSEU|nr:DUF6084 family protein [Kibdelosporangium banguiense]MBP2320028.1 hypothetical protein [Kibdelosporangium banguiense]